jgi:hypothetical protein
VAALTVVEDLQILEDRVGQFQTRPPPLHDASRKSKNRSALSGTVNEPVNVIFAEKRAITARVPSCDTLKITEGSGWGFDAVGEEP